MDLNKVLFVSQEISPYLPETPMAVLGRDLPRSILENGVEVRTFMPKYGFINERRNQLHEVIRLSGMNLIIDDTDHPLIIKVATLQPSRMQVYFIYNEDYFAHNIAKELETVSSPDDNDERSMFFVRGVLETVKKLRWTPEVIHCLGWITAMLPLYIKRYYHDDPALCNCKVVYSLFDDDFEQPLDARVVEKLKLDGFSDDDIKPLLEATDKAALTRLALQHADAVAQCSENVDAATLEAVKASGKPFLPFVPEGDERAKRYIEFYKSL